MAGSQKINCNVPLDLFNLIFLGSFYLQLEEKIMGYTLFLNPESIQAVEHNWMLSYAPTVCPDLLCLELMLSTDIFLNTPAP
jgi:hypothetical protein